MLSYVRLIRATWAACRSLNDEGFEGDKWDWFAEIVRRFSDGNPLGDDFDWDALFELIMEILPVILTIIQLFLSRR